MVEVRAYLDANGNKPFTQWFSELDSSAAAKVTTALTRRELGNFSNVKGVGAGVFEYKIGDRRNASRRTSPPPKKDGPTTRNAKRRCSDASNVRL
jgi:hypothetical protein